MSRPIRTNITTFCTRWTRPTAASAGSIDLEERTDALALDGRRLYVGGDSLRAYSRADGSVEWTFPIETSGPSEDGGLALAGRRIYVADEETVYGVNTASGATV